MDEPERRAANARAARSRSGAARRWPTSPSRISRGRRAGPARGAAPARDRGTHRGGARARPPRARSPASSRRSSRRIRCASGWRAAHARALPVGPPGRGARRVQPYAAAARRRARHRAEPGSCSALERAILNQDPSLDSARPARPTPARPAPPAHEPRAASQQPTPKDRHRAVRRLRAHAHARARRSSRRRWSPSSPPRRRPGERGREARRLDPLVERDRDRRCVRHSARARGRCAAGGARRGRAARGDRLASSRGWRATSACASTSASASTPGRLSRAWPSRRLRWAAPRVSPRGSGAPRRSARSCIADTTKELVGRDRGRAGRGRAGGPTGWRLLELVSARAAFERRLSTCRRSDATRSSTRFAARSSSVRRERSPSLVTVARTGGHRQVAPRARPRRRARRRVPRARRPLPLRTGREARSRRSRRSSARLGGESPLDGDPRASSPATTSGRRSWSASPRRSACPKAAAQTETTFWAVRKLFEALARDAPLVVVFDDLHWADPTFLDLVEYVVDWTFDAPILLLGLARPELLDERPAWAGGKRNVSSLRAQARSPRASRRRSSTTCSAAPGSTPGAARESRRRPEGTRSSSSRCSRCTPRGRVGAPRRSRRRSRPCSRPHRPPRARAALGARARVDHGQGVLARRPRRARSGREP